MNMKQVPDMHDGNDLPPIDATLDAETLLFSPEDVPAPTARNRPSQLTQVESPSVAVRTVPVAPGESLALAWESELLGRLRDAVLGQYEIIGRIGRGGMGAVYLAHDIALDRKVAIKVMLPDLAAGADHALRFRQEARTGAALNHPNIVPVYGVSDQEDLMYFVMKYVEGRSLDGILKETGPLPVSMVQSILHQVGSGLDYGHRNGVIHRDMKPANIMIDGEGLALIADLGVAKVENAQDLTMTGTAIGTPIYMSPEQCKGIGAGPASDQYSLGIVAYQLLTGKTPFRSDAIGALILQHMMDAPAPLQDKAPNCPADLAAVIMKMLEKNPKDRWPTIAAALEHVGGELISQADPARTQIIKLASEVPEPEMFGAGTPVSPTPVGRRKRSRAGVGLFALMAAAAVAAVALPFGPLAHLVRAETLEPVESSGPDALLATALPADENIVNIPDTVFVDMPDPTPPVRNQTGAIAPVERIGTLLLGTRGLAASLVVNGESRGFISQLKSWPVTAGATQISIQVAGCAPWDTTVTVVPGAEARIGYRNPQCSS